MDSIIVLKKEELRTLIRSEVELAVANAIVDNKAQKKTAPKYLTRNEAADELRVSLSSFSGYRTASLYKNWQKIGIS